MFKRTSKIIGLAVLIILAVLFVAALMRGAPVGAEEKASTIVLNATAALRDNQLFIVANKEIVKEYNQRRKNNELQIQILNDVGYNYDWEANAAVRDEELFLDEQVPFTDLRL